MAINAKNALLGLVGGKIFDAFKGSPAAPPPKLETPPPPVVDTAAQLSIAERRKRRMGMTAAPRAGTQLTGPSGVTGAAPTDRRTLLGG